MFTLQIQEAKELMGEIVKEFGEDHVNQPFDGTCMYFNPTTAEPECGVGQLLARKGVTRADLDEEENHAAIDTLMSLRKNQGNPFAQISTRAVEFLRAFQGQQDNMYPWGGALEFALSMDEKNYGN
jgi:hypothetical protein